MFWFRVYDDLIMRKTCNLKHVWRNTRLIDQLLANIDSWSDSTVKKTMCVELDMGTQDVAIKNTAP